MGFWFWCNIGVIVLITLFLVHLVYQTITKEK